jgi:hydroxymethylpyrimidine pyrophosphatase-like HAD family hydrolase/GTPase SAR1 family protein
MRYLALATDYDGTLAHDGRVSEEHLDALQRLKKSGRRIILVTGRQLPELQDVFPEHAIFDLIVAENGALLYTPATKAEVPLAQPPPPAFAKELRCRGALPLAEGRVIVATWEPHEAKVFETIRDLGLEMQVIFNKGAVMILPSGVNKASGLKAALKELQLSPHNVVAVGDAENDHAMLELAEAGVAVSNALPSLKEHADLITAGERGHGVRELIEKLLLNDMPELAPVLKRHDLEIGKLENDQLMRIPAYGAGVLIAGTSGGGKSTLATTLIEKLFEKKYQFCIIDPEGDFAQLENVIVLGDAKRAPSADEVMTALAAPSQNCVVNLIGQSLAERPEYFEKLFARIMHLRVKTGRPHWVIIDEAHHVLPAARDENVAIHPAQKGGLLFITLEPEHVAKSLIEGVDLILAIGGEPRKTITTFSALVGEEPPHTDDRPLEKGEAMAWWREPRGEPFLFHSFTPSLPRHRHIRKYAEGDVKEEAFIFTGPDDKLKLRAQNLFVFLQIGDGVDDLTWNFHLRNGDFENWFRVVIKDPELADFARGLAQEVSRTPEETRRIMREKIEERYTAPK